MKLKTDQTTQSPLFVGKISAQIRKHVIIGCCADQEFREKKCRQPFMGRHCFDCEKCYIDLS